MADILISKRDFFPGMIGVIITSILLVRHIYFWRKFARELKQMYPEEQVFSSMGLIHLGLSASHSLSALSFSE